MSLYVPHSQPLTILFLSLASSAAFNKSLVCSSFHLASFGFSLFLSALWNCCSVNGLHLVTFSTFHILFTAGGVFRNLLLYFQLYTHPIWNLFLISWWKGRDEDGKVQELIWCAVLDTCWSQWFRVIPHPPVLCFDLFSFSRIHPSQVVMETSFLYLTRWII